MNLKNISVDTIVRTIVMFIALINGVCALMGWAPLELDEDMVYAAVSGVALIGSTLWAWWKNNPITPAAQEAQAYLVELKAGEKGEDLDA